MTQKTLRVGLIGAGSIAVRRHVPAWRKEKRAVLVAVCDVDLHRAERLGGDLGMRRAYENLQDMLENESLDICDICTLSGSHAFLAKTCLERGIHTIAEKPMAMTYESGRELYDVVRSSSRKYTVVFNYRYTPQMIALKKLLSEGVLGEVGSMRTQFGWRRPDHHDQFKPEFRTGILFETGIHDIDLCIFLLGDVRKAYAVPSWSAQGGANLVTSVLEHAGGVSSTLQVSFCHPRIEHFLEVCGSKGRARVDFETHHLTVEGASRSGSVLPHLKRALEGICYVMRRKKLLFGSQLSFDRIVSNFVDAVVSDAQPLVTPDQAFYALQVAKELDASIRTGTVQVLEPS